MLNIILFDAVEVRENLLPMTFTRPVADLRVGILTIREKWERVLDGSYSYLTVDYLQEKFPVNEAEENLFVAGNICPTTDLVAKIKMLNVGDVLISSQGEIIAFRGGLKDFSSRNFAREIECYDDCLTIKMLYDIFMENHRGIVEDFALLTHGRASQSLSDTNTVIGNPVDANGNPMIFIEEGAVVEGAMLNVKNGPIYVGRNAEVMEGSCLRGSIALCEHAVVNMGTRMYGATTLGPYCKVGGEVNNVVMMGYSNKAHDGFLGNAVIGEWCNIGGGSTASNLKNDYTEIKLWNYPAHRFLRTGLQFCGLIMGDHSKSGINCMFNTATVLGVGVNIHGAGFPRNFVASFSEGSASGFTDVPLTKFFDIARRMMARRGLTLSEIDMRIFESIHAFADNYK
ncbi:MAG: glucose-1-phosphate thymidylyltransferase [Muribaculaceae bacterium]|nr:glucose-1-phosphate thymidylyltransferase [Muribaculaceae bacterium]